MLNNPKDFICRHHCIPKQNEPYSGFTIISVLPELIGVPWNELSMCYVLSLNPSAVRVSTGEVTSDSYSNRITVIVNKHLIIESISMEVSIPCPGPVSGHELRCALDRFKKK